jgi:type III pantothenate kinase
MVLVLSSGNEITLLGGFNGEELLFTAEFVTPSACTADEYTIKLREMIGLYIADPVTIDGAVFADVSELGADVIRSALKKLSTGRVISVGPGVKTGLNIGIDNPAHLGANIVADAVGAIAKYDTPIIIADMNTATVLTVIDESGKLLGGAIAPGLGVSLSVLTEKTAELPRVNIPADGGSTVNVLGTNTVSCMKSGAVFGTAAIIDGFTRRYTEITGTAKVILTGTYAALTAKYCETAVTVDKDLTLCGLMAIYRRNTAK